MGNSGKTVKPDDDQVKAEEAKVDEIEDAEVVEDPVSEAEETPVELDEPEVEAAEETAGEAEADDVEDPVQEEDTVDEAPVADVTPEETAPAPAEEPAKRGGFVRMVLGGIVAACIGFGGAVYFGDQLGLSGKTDEAIAKVVADLEAQNAALKALQDSAGAASNTANGAAQTATDAAAELAKLQAIYDTKLATLSEAVGGFNERLNDIEKRPLNEGLGAAAIAAYEREVEDLKTLVAEQKADAAELKDKADLSAKAALARSAVTRMIAALDSGAAFSGALVDYRSAGGDEVPAALANHAETGVITMAALTESFPEAARAALAKARAEKVDDAEGSTLGNFFKNQLGARSVEAKEGGSTDAILSRAEAALRGGQLATALVELEGLADAPKSVIADWRAQAETRLAATQAAEAMAQALNTK
ncbi:MAG: hypothetical protein GY883_21150 [Shimia sp.]|nr:hypothetical protein [Shimia sp.]